MRKEYILGILFFSGLWGFFEVVLGGFLYKENIPFSALPLAVIAFLILTIANIYLPQKGTAMFIGAIAMLYKFLNTPFFACHLLAIFLLGVSYDLGFNFFKIKNKALAGILSTYLGFILFAITITYIFRYPHWVNAGFQKVINYIGREGTLVAFTNSIIVPASFYLGQKLKEKTINPFAFKSKFATRSVSLITLSFWLSGLTRWF